MRVLFIIKKRLDSGGCYGSDSLGGLFNSANFVVEMLNEFGVIAKIVQVTDNNDIDREVTEFKPSHVIVEALWVVPEKFTVLVNLHPKVKWVVRIHSEIPFLALEGNAIDWISHYVLHPNVLVASNSSRATRDLRNVLHEKNPYWTKRRLTHEIVYLPNWYPVGKRPIVLMDPAFVDIGCFGAIRPFKNQLTQAIAAMQFADSMAKSLRFHINGTRCEQGGENILKNLRALFANTRHHLVEHEWKSHEDFIRIISKMDASMAVSFSETFNIISADAVVSRVPIVVSSEVRWASPRCFASPNDVADMVGALHRVTSPHMRWLLTRVNIRNLKSYSDKSVFAWLDYLLTGNSVL